MERRPECAVPPKAGTAGYVAIETVEGRLGDLAGGFALQQFGMMCSGSQTQQYVIVPGSGCGALEKISGQLELTIESDGTHRFLLNYELRARVIEETSSQMA